ncbi:thaumatin-like protein [Phellopilus nigrolimitatus]|nr:thaumatin-like protein [Phellopilus nigrolimitatus]
MLRYKVYLAMGWWITKKNTAMIKLASFAAIALALASTTLARTFTVKNSCNYTVWPAVYTDMTSSKVKPNIPTGWEAPAGSGVQFFVPDNWTSGRIWGRRDCDFSTNPGPNSCSTGGCNGGLECISPGGTGVPPASLAEWTLNGGNGSTDYYDVSLVDGFNIPISITNDKNCPPAECAADLGATCPTQLKHGDNGCYTACKANLDGNPQNSSSCCSGSFSTPQTCPSSGVQYYSFFKNACPNSYAYPYDEGSGTALRNCSSTLSPDYTLTFCP